MARVINAVTNLSLPGFMQDEVYRAISSLGCIPGKDKKVKAMPGRLLATYPLLPTFKYCERLYCYADNVAELDPSIPPPQPPPTRKSDIFDLSQYGEVDERAINTPTSYHKETLGSLVDYLTAGYQDDMSKIRVIYRWITCQPIDRMLLRREPPTTQAMFQLWRIKNKKGNYAQLVSLLCRYANIPCVIVHGVLKGSTYEVGDQIDDDKHYGEWNAVLIDGHWRFINAYWGTCAEGASDTASIVNGDAENGDDENGGRMYYCCDENYFLTDPDQTAATHLPSLAIWQLKKKPIELEEFEKMTFVKDRFFNLQLKILSHPECVIKNDNGFVEMRFGVPKKMSQNLDFQYLLYKLTGDDESRADRYVFLHRTNNHETLCVKIRSPLAGIFRFELVGKDNTITDETYDYDWIAIYKIIFNKGHPSSIPYPPQPSIGWGPGKAARDVGLAPLSHTTGEVIMDDHGRAEIRFGAANTFKTGDMAYAAMLFTGGETVTELQDQVVHRVENGDVVFNVLTPEMGEFVLKLFVKSLDYPGKGHEFCNYLLISDQKEKNGRYPKGFTSNLGAKQPAFAESGMHPTVSSGFITTMDDSVKIGFRRTEDIELSVNFSGDNVKPAEAPLLLSQEEKDSLVTYTVRLPQSGQYGVKVRGTRLDGAVHEPLYDYVIDHRKAKKRTSKEPSIKQEAETFRETESENGHEQGPEPEVKSASTDKNTMSKASSRRVRITESVTSIEDDIDQHEVKEEEEEEEEDMESEDDSDEEYDSDTNINGVGGPESGLGDDVSSGQPRKSEYARQQEEIERHKREFVTKMNDILQNVLDDESIPDVLRRRLRMAIEENDSREIQNVLRELKGLNLASVQQDIETAESEFQLMKLRTELQVAIREKDSVKLKTALRKVDLAGCEDKLAREVAVAKQLLLRIKRLQKLLHAILEMEQSTIAEMRSYSNPPAIVKRVMMATLLLLGHFEEETAKWKMIQTILGKTGKESIKRLIAEFKIENCPLEVAMGAKDFIRDFTMEQVRLVSAGAATFYVWVRGVIQELETRAGDEINNIRPRTCKMRKKFEREMTFLRDIETSAS